MIHALLGVAVLSVAVTSWLNIATLTRLRRRIERLEREAAL